MGVAMRRMAGPTINLLVTRPEVDPEPILLAASGELGGKPIRRLAVERFPYKQAEHQRCLLEAPLRTDVVDRLPRRPAPRIATTQIIIWQTTRLLSQWSCLAGPQVARFGQLHEAPD